MNRRLTKASLVLLTVLLIALALVGSSSSQSQQAPTLRIVSEDGNKLRTILITGNDMQKLPAGTTYIGSSANGGVWKTTNGGQSADLVKTGVGSLILPNPNAYGVTKVGPGTLKNSDGGGTAKEGRGTLVLTSSSDAAFEFRNLSAADFDRVSISVNNETLTLNGNGYMGRHRPVIAMSGWPFQTLVLLRSGKIAQFGSTNPIKLSSGASKYSCEAGRFCSCNGPEDCEALLKSNSCESMMNCDIGSSGLRCFCDAR